MTLKVRLLVTMSYPQATIDENSSRRHAMWDFHWCPRSETHVH